MAAGDKRTGHRYADLKRNLWNQPRPRQFLERLEEKDAPSPILESVAAHFANGRFGEAEIQTAIYYDLLRHRDRAALQERVTDLQNTLSRISQDLLHLSENLRQLKIWEAYRPLGYVDWGEFAEKAIHLSEETVSRLLILDELEKDLSLDTLLQVLIKGYTAAATMEGMVPKLPEDWCMKVLRDLRWGGRIQCPRCGTSGAWLHRRSGHIRYYRCPDCRSVFSHLTGTVFEGTRLPLSVWFSAIRSLLLQDRLTARGLEHTFRIHRVTARNMRNRLLASGKDPLIRSIGAMVISREIELRSRRHHH